MDVEWIIDYLSPAARREVLRVVRQVQEAAERCPTCHSEWRNELYIECWTRADPWHGEQKGDEG